MPAYFFTAVTEQGQEQTGVIEAENERQARQLVRDKSLIPLSLRAQQTAKEGRGERRFWQWQRQERIGTKALALLTRQLATLLQAGLPLEEALTAVAEQTEKSATKGLLLSVRGKVLEGYAFAASLKEHPEAFSALFCATIAAGEKSGHLDAVLLRLADYTEQQAAMRQKLKTALIYPVMIVLVAFGIVGFLLEYVVPKMVAVYARMDQALPLLTQVLLAVSHFVQVYGFYLIVTLVLAMMGWRYALKKHEALREQYHQFLLRLPLIGYALKTADTARFTRTLSILSAAGVPVVDAMLISAQLMTTIPILKAVTSAVHRVREGTAIHLALKQAGFFSPMSIHMIASGEASGQLENMLERVAKSQEEDITRLIEVALALFEPAIILVMGVIVLFIVLAVLLPIFQLNQFTG